jgi:hypothetical protein
MYSVQLDFKAGLDRRRPQSASPPGSLWECINAHITRGGDIEKRKAFVAAYELPPMLTFGLARAASNLYTFGSIASVPVPTGITYQRLIHPSGLNMIGILDTDTFDGKVYAIAQYADGSIHHFYNGSRVTDWDALTTPTPTIIGTACKTHKNKMYACCTSLLQFSKLADATQWDTIADTGANFINMSNQDGGSESLTGLGIFQKNLAVFAPDVLQIWAMTADPANNTQLQVLKNTGTDAKKSIIAFGNEDLAYLDTTGIRSLRSRVGIADLASVDDVGTPIDTYVQEHIDGLSTTVRDAACSIIDPRDGRLWMAIGDRVFVYSSFPRAKINAWSTYEPGFVISAMVTLNRRIYARSEDTIYLYGGETNAEYDSSTVTVELPFFHDNKPANYKSLRGFDADLTGRWDVQVLVDPRDTSRYVDVGRFEGITYLDGNAGMPVRTTMAAPKFVCTASGYARISNFAVHFDKGAVEAA